MVKSHTFETYGEAIHFIHEPYGQKRMVWAKMSGLKRMAQKNISVIPYISHMARNRMVWTKRMDIPAKKMHQMKSISDVV